MTFPDAPTDLANEAVTTSATVIALTWTEGAENGGSPVIDYRVSYLPVGGSTFSVLASGITTQAYSTTALT